MDFVTGERLRADLADLGVATGDGLFVHSAMRPIGQVIGGPRTVVAALLEAVGRVGLIAMPGYSSDAMFPPQIDRAACSPEEIAEIEAAVPGYDRALSPTYAMGAVAECFRTWPGTRRSGHPTISVCLNGVGAEEYAAVHDLEWACGENAPLGALRGRARMKIMLVGVGWNRCSALHTAEVLAGHRRTKMRRFKLPGATPEWREVPDAANDMNRLFPAVGAAFEETGAVTRGRLGEAEVRICDYAALVDFATGWIDAANARSGDRH